MSFSKTTLLAGWAVLAAGATQSLANTSFFVAPSFRGQAGTSFAGWEAFSAATGANSPDLAGSTANATFAQNTPGAFLTGSGNIYAGPPPTVGTYSVSYDGSSPVGAVVFQARTVGLELDYSSISLNYGSGSLSATRTQLENAVAGGGPGAVSVSSSWSWDLTGLNASDFTISFNAASPDVSFDAAHLDVASVPEPQTWALAAAGFGLVVFAGWRRR
jgi:hypothetical protein